MSYFLFPEPYIYFSEETYTLEESENPITEVCVKLGNAEVATQDDIWVNIASNFLSTLCKLQVLAEHFSRPAVTEIEWSHDHTSEMMISLSLDLTL